MSLLFTIEGLDGTGKTTLAKELGLALSRFSPWVYVTKEPGLETHSNGIKFNRPGVDFRTIALTNKSLTALERELLFYADASQHARFIENQGEALIVSDRGYWSHLAYARACLKTKQLNYDEYHICKDIIEMTSRKPNKVIYLRGSLALMKQRLVGKEKDVIESNSEDYFGYVLEHYEDLAFENENCLILDACNSTSNNVEAVIKFINEQYTNEQLRSGSQ